MRPGKRRGCSRAWSRDRGAERAGGRHGPVGTGHSGDDTADSMPAYTCRMRSRSSTACAATRGQGFLRVARSISPSPAPMTLVLIRRSRRPRWRSSIATWFPTQSIPPPTSRSARPGEGPLLRAGFLRGRQRLVCPSRRSRGILRRGGPSERGHAEATEHPLRDLAELGGLREITQRACLDYTQQQRKAVCRFEDDDWLVSRSGLDQLCSQGFGVDRVITRCARAARRGAQRATEHRL